MRYKEDYSAYKKVVKKLEIYPFLRYAFNVVNKFSFNKKNYLIK